MFVLQRNHSGIDNISWKACLCYNSRYIITRFPCWYQPVGAGNACKPARADFVGDANTPANETADLVSLNMAAPVRSVSDMRDNPKTLNRSGVYIYNFMTRESRVIQLSGRDWTLELELRNDRLATPSEKTITLNLVWHWRQSSCFSYTIL